MADVLSAAAYATACFGKWHIGAAQGRWPTDHGFDEWYGPPRSYDECLWSDDPWYDPQVAPTACMLEGRKGEHQFYLRVYGRQGEPCYHCGTRIRRIVIGSRSSHFCPHCQKVPK